MMLNCLLSQLGLWKYKLIQKRRIIFNLIASNIYVHQDHCRYFNQFSHVDKPPALTTWFWFSVVLFHVYTSKLYCVNTATSGHDVWWMDGWRRRRVIIALKCCWTAHFEDYLFGENLTFICSNKIKSWTSTSWINFVDPSCGWVQYFGFLMEFVK